MLRKLALACAVAALFAGHLAAGVVYEIEVTDHEASPPRVFNTELSVEGSALKMGIEPSAEGRADGAMIWLGERREMVVVNHEEQYYSVLDQETIESLASTLSGAMSQIQEALKNVPEDRRAMVEQMMRQRMPQEAPAAPALEITRTSERETMLGYPCVKYTMATGGLVVRELWVTDWEYLEGSKEVSRVFVDMADFISQMMESVGQIAGSLPGAGNHTAIMAEMGKLDGFPVVTRELDARGEIKNESVLRAARRQKIDPQAFEPPEGYTLRSMVPR